MTRVCTFYWTCEVHRGASGGRVTHTCGLHIQPDELGAHYHHYSYAYDCSIMSKEPRQ